MFAALLGHEFPAHLGVLEILVVEHDATAGATMLLLAGALVADGIELAGRDQAPNG